MNTINLVRCVACLSFLILTLDCHAQEWPRFRGPNGSGVSLESNIPSQWEAEDYAWSVELEGKGSSSPVVWGDKVFVLSASAKNSLALQCFNLETGKENWVRPLKSDAYPIHQQNSFASSTPAVDEERVYLAFAGPKNITMVALDHDGTEVWQRDFGRWVSQHGFGGSPLVYKDLLIFCNSQQADRLAAGKEPGQSRMMAVNKLTGDEVWQSDLTTTRVCYSMPAIYSVEGEPDQLINCNTGDGFYSLNPESGETNWKKYPFKKRTVASTLLVNDMVYGSSGSGGGGNSLVAAKIGADGDKPEKAFEINRNANYVPSPVAVGDLLFLFGDRGVVSCVDVNSGKEHWKERLGRGFSGSPVATSTHVYCIDQQGVCHVVAAKAEFEKTASVNLGEPSRATPAIVGDRILLRTESHLMALKGK